MLADSNPYTDETALEASCYTRWVDDALLAWPEGAAAPALADRVHGALRALVLDPEFPCVGARSALNQGSYRFAMYKELGSGEASAGLARDLFTFVAEQDSIEGEFTTFIVAFDTPKAINAEEFERLLWGQLEDLHKVDQASWDPDVSSDPRDPTFSFSFAGRAFFVVGLSPAGERWARTFPWPTLAFNPHAQFERLRERGEFERIQSVIRDRDRELEGDLNPNLSNFGEHTEARQYSGREVEPDWVCPAVFQ